MASNAWIEPPRKHHAMRRREENLRENIKTAATKQYALLAIAAPIAIRQ
jgi:hypothetical protein